MPLPLDPATRQKNQDAYWRRTRQLTGKLLALWFAVIVITIFFARELSGVMLFGWPVSFYMAAQGSGLIFLAIVAVYAWRMRHIEQMMENDNSDANNHVQ